jgi:hypothetical protein
LLEPQSVFDHVQRDNPRQDLAQRCLDRDGALKFFVGRGTSNLPNISEQ